MTQSVSLTEHPPARSGRFGVSLQLAAEHLCEAMDLHPGARLLDVASGNGAVALAAARRDCRAIAADAIPEMLHQAQARAAAEGLALGTCALPGNTLPFDTGKFDYVAAAFGYTSPGNAQSMRAELIRVCRCQGRIGLSGWAADGFVGGVAQVISSYMPPDCEAPIAIAPQHAQALEAELAQRVGIVRTRQRQLWLRHQSPKQWLAVFAAGYAPLRNALSALRPAAALALEAELLSWADAHNHADDGTFRTPASYLEFVITR